MVILCMVSLFGISLFEVWMVREWLPLAETVKQFLGQFGFLAVGLFVYSFLVARMVLALIYHIDNAGFVQTTVMLALALFYASLMWVLPHSEAVILLGFSKLLGVFLFSLFWRNQLLEERWRNREVPPTIFFTSLRAFLVCRWVLLAVWLLKSLGLALALVTVHPVIQLSVAEGMMLLGSFFLLFSIFVRNPLAHRWL